MLSAPERRRSKSTQGGSPRHLPSDPLPELEAMQYTFVPLPPSNVHGFHLVELMVDHRLADPKRDRRYSLPAQHSTGVSGEGSERDKCSLEQLLVSVSLNGEVTILRWGDKKVEVVANGSIFEGYSQYGEVSCSTVLKCSDGSLLICAGAAESATITARDKSKRVGAIHFTRFEYSPDVVKWPLRVSKSVRVPLERRSGVPIFLMADWINEQPIRTGLDRNPVMLPFDGTKRRRSGLVNTLPPLSDASPELMRAADASKSSDAQDAGSRAMGPKEPVSKPSIVKAQDPAEPPLSSEPLNPFAPVKTSLVVFLNDISDDRETYRAALYTTSYQNGELTWTSSQDIGKAWSMVFTGSNKVGAPTAADWTSPQGIIDRLLVLGHHTGVVQAYWCPAGEDHPVVTCEVSLETPISAVKTRTFIEGSVGEAIFTLVAPALGPVRIYSVEAESTARLKMTTVFVTSPPEAHDVLLSAYWNLVPHYSSADGSSDQGDHRMVLWLGHFGKLIVKYEEWPNLKLAPAGYYQLPSGAFAILPRENDAERSRSGEEIVLVRTYHGVHLLGFPSG